MIDNGRLVRRAGRRGADVRCRSGAWGSVPILDPVEAPDLAIEVARVDGAVAVVAVSGEIDLHTAETLRSRLAELHGEGRRHLVVDFGGVEFCDATGLGALVAVHNRLGRDGGGIRLARMRPAQARLLGITGLDRVFTLHDDIVDAVAEATSAARRSRG